MLDQLQIDLLDHMLRLREVVHQKETIELRAERGLVLPNLMDLLQEVVLLQDHMGHHKEGLLRKGDIARLQDQGAILLLPEARALQEVIVRLRGRAHLPEVLARLQDRDQVHRQGAIVLRRDRVLLREASVHRQDQVEAVQAVVVDQVAVVEEEDKRSG